MRTDTFSLTSIEVNRGHLYEYLTSFGQSIRQNKLF